MSRINNNPLRKVDDLGRICIPYNIRKELGLDEDVQTWVEITRLNDGIFIKKKDFKYKGDK